MTGILVQIDGQEPRLFEDEFTIGSRGADLIVADDYASAVHAKVWPYQGLWGIEDMGSTNGTWLNGRKIYEGILGKGNRLRIGRTSMTIVPL